MNSDPIAIIEGLYAARRARDLATTMAYVHDDVRFTFNVHPDRLGDGETVVGIAACEAHLARVAAKWETLAYDVGPLRGDGDVFRAIITFKLRRRSDNFVLEGTKRHEWVLRDGKVAELDEILDSELVLSLLRYDTCDPVA